MHRTMHLRRIHRNRICFISPSLESSPPQLRYATPVVTNSQLLAYWHHAPDDSHDTLTSERVSCTLVCLTHRVASSDTVVLHHICNSRACILRTRKCIPHQGPHSAPSSRSHTVIRVNGPYAYSSIVDRDLQVQTRGLWYSNTHWDMRRRSPNDFEGAFCAATI